MPRAQINYSQRIHEDLSPLDAAIAAGLEKPLMLWDTQGSDAQGSSNQLQNRPGCRSGSSTPRSFRASTGSAT